jgi:hypothetical protein
MNLAFSLPKGKKWRESDYSRRALFVEGLTETIL